MMTGEKAGTEAFFLVAHVSSSFMASHIQVIPPSAFGLKELKLLIFPFCLLVLSKKRKPCIKVKATWCFDPKTWQ